MSDSEDQFSSDSEDEDYVPSGGEISEDSEPEGEEEDRDFRPKGKKAAKKGQKKNKSSLPVSFLKDVGGPPARPKTSSAGGLGSLTQKTSSVAASTSQTQAKPKSKVTVTKVYDFAGEEVKVSEEVDADSVEATSTPPPPDERTRDSSSTSSGPVPQQSSSTAVPRLGDPQVKRPVGGGLGSVLSKISKKPKMSTLVKSKLDWDTYKKEEQIEEDLAIHNRGKEGYLERQAFLQRTDLRQFEEHAKITPAGNHPLPTLEDGQSEHAKITPAGNHPLPTMEDSQSEHTKITPVGNHPLPTLEDGQSEHAKITPAGNHPLPTLDFQSCKLYSVSLGLRQRRVEVVVSDLARQETCRTATFLTFNAPGEVEKQQTQRLDMSLGQCTASASNRAKVCLDSGKVSFYSWTVGGYFWTGKSLQSCPGGSTFSIFELWTETLAVASWKQAEDHDICPVGWYATPGEQSSLPVWEVVFDTLSSRPHPLYLLVTADS
ncbi:Craniofacial development protein 1 [Branchiostoma belcheri]|nr:Craniofacial development protein 1 [Branchiostoma belcheri]